MIGSRFARRLCLLGGLLLLTGANHSAQAAILHPAGVAPGESYHRIFVTSELFFISNSVSFPPPVGVVNGLLGADWNVNLAAFTSGLLPDWNGIDTPYKAILSTSTVNANTRFSIVGKVFNTLDEKVADNSADFWDGSLDNAIRYDEYGVPVSTSEVWSGSTSTGNYSGLSCGDWVDSSDGGNYGDASTAGSAWLLASTQNCSNTARVYGISPAIMVPVPEPTTLGLLGLSLAMLVYGGQRKSATSRCEQSLTAT